ncbi:PDZ domain-containing protein [Xanthomonas vesicatoria]|uniref:PDZ domain-containing protein n=1 Tax=Xanthomonas vesicatoria TaxID=56460 RepID=UPI001E2DA831|nr:PDZ domain-containing protein [Xanthomonas vesicatoria]MCC8628241.1 PDZ domain-containing protein [Xanthomonas vesicatoria]
MRPIVDPRIVAGVLAIAAVSGALLAGDGAAVHPATPTTGQVTERTALRIDDHQLHWRRDALALVLPATADGLRVTQASEPLALQLRKGDQVRAAGGHSIATVDDLLYALRAAAGRPIQVQVARGQAQLSLTWTSQLYGPLLPPLPPAPPSPPQALR